MSKKAIIIGVIILIILAVGIPATVYLAQQQQTLKSRAQTPAGGDQACTPPGTVANVKVNYPSCIGSDCSFTSASCTWDAAAGVVTYNVKVTEVDSSTAVNVPGSVSANTTSVVFPITQGKTYQCDISAINSCGATGGVGTASLLCKVDGILASPSPSATVAPSSTPVPTPVPTPAPTVAPLSCGASLCNTTPCAAGLTCVQAANGQAFCSKPAFLSACASNPSQATCCNAAAQVPTLPVSGDSDNTLMMIIAGLALVVFAAFSIRLTRK